LVTFSFLSYIKNCFASGVNSSSDPVISSLRDIETKKNEVKNQKKIKDMIVSIIWMRYKKKNFNGSGRIAGKSYQDCH